MAIITYPLNNIEYTAEDAELYHATRTSGVFANDDFPITVSGDGNVVTIGEGIGWIRNSKFSGKVVANKAEMSLDLGLPHATYPRIDAVVLRFSANANASEIIVKNGTAQTNPTPPEVVRTESVYELHLYHVYREAGAASVTASNVTDLRSDSAYCGIMSDDVTMLGDDYVSKNMVGVANGVASLGSNGKVPSEQLPYSMSVENLTSIFDSQTIDYGTISSQNIFIHTVNGVKYLNIRIDTIMKNPVNGQIYFRLNKNVVNSGSPADGSGGVLFLSPGTVGGVAVPAWVYDRYIVLNAQMESGKSYRISGMVAIL